MKFSGKYAWILLAGLCSAQAHAAPGWDVTSFATSAQNAPKIVAAMDRWMGGAGADYPGQVTLYANEADGNDPATHTIIVTYPSMAASEGYAAGVAGDEKKSAAWGELMATFVANASPGQTMRGAFVRNWGEVDPADSVWMHHMITARDAPAVVAALNRWMNSPTGKKAPGQVHLSRVVAGGIGAPSHVLSVGYASMAELETWQDSLAGNEDYAAFLEEASAASVYHGANMAVRVKAWGASPVQATAAR
jgi:hypothetical protein